MNSMAHGHAPSFSHRAKRSALVAMQQYLPAAVYSLAYDSGFGAVRLLRRLLYGRFWLKAVLTGDSAQRARAETVLGAMPYSLVGWRGLQLTYDVAVEAQRHQLTGSLVECGVAQGGSAAVLGSVERDTADPRTLWLFDSFEGLPDPTTDDFVDGATGTHIRPLPRGSCLGTAEQVSSVLLDVFHLDRDRVRLVKGWFHDTLPEARERVGPIAVLRIDADWYESVKCCLDMLFDQVVPAGYVILDDYWSCYGARKAVDEFIAARDLAVTLNPDGRGGCYFIKPAL